jgi:hypothetical protein
VMCGRTGEDHYWISLALAGFSTEGSRAGYLRNAAVPRASKGAPNVDRWRPDCLAGAAGFETMHSK